MNAALTTFLIGQNVFVPESVCSARDSILPVEAVIKEVHPEGRYVVRARGDNLWVTTDEIKLTAEEWCARDAAARARSV